MNVIQFHFKNLLIIVYPAESRVYFISWTGEVCSLTINQAINVMEKVRREKFGKGIHGKVSRS